MRESIPIEIRITMVLTQLDSRNSLQMCREVYGIKENTTSIISEKKLVSNSSMKCGKS